MNWNVKEDFCADGSTYSLCAPRVYNLYPKINIETSRKLTEEERRRVIDTLVKAASVEMIHINKENNNAKLREV